MMNNYYLSVCMFQLDVNLNCDSEKEYLIEDEKFLKQIESAFFTIKQYNPDVVLFPEMTYFEKYDDTYKELSNSKIIVAGSYYKEGINTTVIFENGQKIEIPKIYASGAEPMARKVEYIDPEKFIKDNLKEHEFWIKGKKVYILNCMEYYHTAYYISRNEELKKDLFGIFAICSNSNTRVFEEETVCIHNHNEGIYTFVLNCISTYKDGKYGDGKSYIYGPISQHEKEWLLQEGTDTKRNVCHVLSLSNKKAQFVYGQYVFAENLSRFGRSDKYINNPRNIKVENL